VPASQIATEWINYLISRLMPARRLPKLDFSQDGIPDAYRTLVVVPMLLTDHDTIISEVEKLEVRFIGNREHNLVFALFSDFTDAPTQVTEEDEGFLQLAQEGIHRLNRTYGQGHFYLFHRQRTWSESEEKYIGWERKRGKLEELNRLILGQRLEDEPHIVYVGESNRLTDIRYVITLDSDTQLPRDSARRMIETLAHPLNQPRYDKSGKVAQGTYTLIQPRVSSSLPSATATLFSRIYTDPVGTDPYTKVVSNAYQDLSGEGSYIGKGIYDPRAFQHMLTDRFPDESLLSHDLIEGAHVRTGLASDIELFDEFPSDYISYSRRQHRWIRGDWQIADWIFSKVRDKNHQKTVNILGPLSRWKILDNLRRSLVPASSLAVLVLTWFFVPELQLFTSALIAGVILFQPLAGPLTWVTTRQGLKAFSPRQIQHDLTRAFTEAALLMHQAGLALDAIVRVLYRRLISRGLLEWSTAQMDQERGKQGRFMFQLNFWLISILSSGLIVSVFLLRPENLSFALPWLLMWFFSPLVGWLLTMKRSVRAPHQIISGRSKEMLRRVARRTWRYFADFVGPETAWLPPDNYQVSHQNQLAMRTSPTNIGMYMLSALGANDFGYLTLDQTIERLTQTMATLNSLERHEGHLLNWYNLEDQTPLQPRYVSSVDSGNFIATLWTLEQGIKESLERPILSESALGGLQDTAEILLEELEKEKSAPESQQQVLILLELIQDCPPGVIELIKLLRAINPEVESIADILREDAGTHAGAAYWARQLERQVTAWINVIDRYLPWMEILVERSEVELIDAGLLNLVALRRELHNSPSIKSLTGSYVSIARGDVPADHWLALNRPYSSHGQHRVLLSWTGTMFEYLMPLLLQRSYPNSLLDQATRETVALQMAYGRNRRVPWGISESAYGDLDLNKTYQYKAFGVPWLGLKRDLEEDLVVAPYATMLAIGLEPQAAVKNLERLEKHGLLNDYGFFESIDFLNQMLNPE
jgi:cyclic beta-1,2-glucan synthetase